MGSACSGEVGSNCELLVQTVARYAKNDEEFDIWRRKSHQWCWRSQAEIPCAQSGTAQAAASSGNRATDSDMESAPKDSVFQWEYKSTLKVL